MIAVETLDRMQKDITLVGRDIRKRGQASEGN